MFHVESIAEKDAASFVSFLEQVAQETDFLLFSAGQTPSVEAQLEKIKGMATAQSQAVFVAKDDNGSVVGFLGMTRLQPPKVKHIANMAMAVLSSHRRQGIASMLMTAAEEWAQTQNISRLELTTMAHNLPALNCYLKNGYQIEGVRQNAIQMHSTFFNEVYMAKLLV